MNKNRKNQFYEIIKKEDEFQVLRENTLIFTLQCEDLIQCHSVLIAKTSDEYSIYMPSFPRFGDDYEFKKGFICVLENVKEFIYHNKTKSYHNDDMLLLKLETDDSSGYWTAIHICSFERDLTPEKAKSRSMSLFKIPYTGTSRATFMEEFDYLPWYKYLINIDESIYFIDVYDRDLTTGSSLTFFCALGNVQVEPSPFIGFFKVISNEGVSFFNASGEGCRKDFGPFFDIDKAVLHENDIQKDFPIYYLAKNEHNEILGIFSDEFFGNERSIVFDNPVTDVQFVRMFKPSKPFIIFKQSITFWKLLDKHGKSQILLWSSLADRCISEILDISDFI